jgi:SAM-dependent methyltransferase
MTPEMISLAQKNAATADGGAPFPNVEFHLAQIDRLPLRDSTVDCVISNCVINLAADKPAVFREIFRVLKPGGRLAASDIALKQPLPPDLAQDLMAYVGCVAGAILTADYEAGLRAAGFSAVEVVDTRADLNAYTQIENQSGCCSPRMTDGNGLEIVDSGCCSPAAPSAHVPGWDTLKQYDVNQFAASVRVYAVKP